MFRVEFSKYNDIMNKIMDEQTTLEVHLSAEYSQNAPKKFSNFTPEEWAKYAFEKGAEYSLNYYRNNKPYCEVLIDSMTISLSYYNDINISKKDLMIVLFKGEMNQGEFEFYSNGKVFLKQITWYSELAKTILFYSNKKKNNVFLEEWILEDRKKMLIEQYGTADLSNHWFDAPQNYLDYERFLDYQKLFNELPSLES